MTDVPSFLPPQPLLLLLLLLLLTRVYTAETITMFNAYAAADAAAADAAAVDNSYIHCTTQINWTF